jgi:hypothetical protein
LSDVRGLTTDCSALIVIYLLSGSWLPMLLSVARYTSFCNTPRFVGSWKRSSIYSTFTFQAFVLCGFVFSVLHSWPTYGFDAICNDHRVLALFRPFELTTTVRMSAMALLGLIPLGLSIFITSRPALPYRKMPTYWICALLGLMMALWITNVELLRIYNKPQIGEQSWVSFGQVEYSYFIVASNKIIDTGC